ncbi:MAG: ATPase, T2SS/T4P/T4SS family [Erysipelotrichaceae bacterium]|nr:ATPase, T2SS/T4P/T4SS family [Erysipelotrichaceae bacterium]
MEPMQKLERLLIIALSHKATDIHIKQVDKNITFKLRSIDRFIDVEETEYDIELFNYLQYIANLDLADYNMPQTGSFQFTVNNRRLFLRLAVLRTFDQVSSVLRILYQKVINDKISLFIEQERMINKKLRSNEGLILISGPTGSGKTTTAYSLLQKLASRRVYTIEDPIEMFFPNIIQIQVNKRQGLDYQTGIKQLLRHDPDVIFIGEIRDEHEAQMAIRSALTGHLVIATIHAKDCAGAILRIQDLNVNMFDFYQSTSMIINQRLLPRLYKRERIVLYEIMVEKDLEYYKNTNEIPKDYKTLEHYRKKAIKNKLISSKTPL